MRDVAHIVVWLVVALAIALFANVLFTYGAPMRIAAQSPPSSYVHGSCEDDGGRMVDGVTVYVDRQVQFAGVGWQWQAYPKSSTTNISGWWGITVPLDGVGRLRLRPVAPRDCRLVGARFPGGYQARYVQGVGVELPPPGGGSAGNFTFLFECREEPTPTVSPTPSPTVTATPTAGPRSTMTPFPGVEEWTDPPQTLENVVVEESLQLVAGWLKARDELYHYAYNKGLGCFPVQGPNRFMFTDVFGETWTIEYCLYPRGWLVWRDIRWPNKIRATKVMDPFWW